MMILGILAITELKMSEDLLNNLSALSSLYGSCNNTGTKYNFCFSFTATDISYYVDKLWD